jgi:hypothetical protein
VKVVERFHEQGSVLAGTAAGFCDGFDIEVEIESDAPPKEVGDLVRLSRKMCFTEQALAGHTPVKVTTWLNGQPLEG